LCDGRIFSQIGIHRQCRPVDLAETDPRRREMDSN
jgi:hypothetical protein